MIVTHKPEETDTPDYKNITSKVRRTFLKRASAGIVIGSIPGRSAWAGMAGSIVASGHGSDFQQGKCTKLRGPSYFENDTDSFLTVFGYHPFDRHGAEGILNVTFAEIYNAVRYMAANKHDLSNSEKNTLKDTFGPAKVNLWLFVFYFNSKYNTLDSSIEYNAASQHGGPDQFANYLYNQAVSGGPRAVGRLLKSTYQKYKNGNAC